MKFFLIGCFICLIPFFAFSQPLIELNKSDTTLLAGKMCAIKIAGSASQTIETIMQATDFVPHNNEQLLLGVDDTKDVWLKFTILNTQSELCSQGRAILFKTDLLKIKILFSKLELPHNH
jgi:hypothetical protein